MSETPGETHLDQAGMHALSAALATGAAVLDEAAASAPHAPDAGVSTPLIGDLLAGMSGAVGDLVTAVDVTATSVRHSDETLGNADSGGAGRALIAFSEELDTAATRLQQAREVVVAGGLTVTPQGIEPPPTVIGPAEAHHSAAFRRDRRYQAQVRAWNEAHQTVNHARGIELAAHERLATATNVPRSMFESIRSNGGFIATGAILGAAGSLHAENSRFRKLSRQHARESLDKTRQIAGNPNLSKAERTQLQAARNKAGDRAVKEHRIARSQARLLAGLDGPVELPPRPDPQTGEPRPPPAPVTWDGGGDPETDPRRRPKAPPGQGPLLEWHRDSRRYIRGLAGFVFGLMFVVMTLIAGGFSWMTDWVFWVIVLLGPLVIPLSKRSQWMAAGADWFASDTGWVKIYELAKVELAGMGVSPRLYLTDTEGRATHAELRRMQANARLWDLVYNGIIHSIHTRDVKVNTSAQIQIIDVGLPRHRRD